MPQVCAGPVSDIWESLWPGKATASKIIIIGCGVLKEEPTQPLLDKGAGGLFIDMDKTRVRHAIFNMAAPSRLILNMSVQAHHMRHLVKEHRSFAKGAEVIQVDIDTVDGPVMNALLEVTSPVALVVELREFLPMPFRYSCLTTDTKGLAWGGSNLAYWLHALGLRGFYLARMDGRDAVFLHKSISSPQTRSHLLGAMGCYLSMHAFHFEPTALISGSIDDAWTRTQHYWMESNPHDVMDEVWQNLTSWKGDIQFSLEL
ncbi:unnamed protein product [Polarella glacialis]|uniref:Uncharacterized protein n=2 Tax=Polarella glacialis TaxID=89957 RepID=A0A813H7I4_POLGL|nr:unnamed protein product [Polarella glacialis]